MFENMAQLASDPILGLMGLYRSDPNPNKIDLGVGVYKDELGHTPVMAAIKEAEHRVIGKQVSKSYVGPAGNPSFVEQFSKMLLGENSPVLQESRFSAAQTPGGCGALRVAAELVVRANPKATIWVSDPTWGNHIPLLGDSGLAIKTYPYFDPVRSCLDFEKMHYALSKVKRGDLVLLHGCCHNPSGVDLSIEQWQLVAELAQKQGFTPFIDMAYQGFGDGLEEDAQGLRIMAEALPEVILAASCSKNFGLYRERVGLVGVIAEHSKGAEITLSHLLSIARGIYSMPPDHGAALVAQVLRDPELKKQWQGELEQMRVRITGLRRQFSTVMRHKLGHDRFDFVEHQKGMFSFMGLTQEQVKQLRSEYGVYILDSSRTNLAGLNTQSIEVVCEALTNICTKGG